jgi:hypothetical protein
MSEVALTNVILIRHILPFMVANMQELVTVRLVNKSWQDCVENYGVCILRHLFSEYKQKGVPKEIYNTLKSKEFNWIWYICIEYNIFDVNTILTNQQDCILHVAVEFNNISLVEYLIEKKANIEAKNGCDQTALIVAIMKGHKECLLLLLEKGANVETKCMNSLKFILHI